MRRPGTDAGSATVWTVGGIAALFVFVLAGMLLASATLTRHRAASAADLAALAAASYVSNDARSACGRAAWVSANMRTTLTRCRIVGLDAYVELSIRPAGMLGSLGAATARARAGPAAPG